MGLVFFLFINPFFIQIPIKHSKHFDKLVYDHKKNQKQLQKPKSNRSQNDSCGQIYLFVQGEGKKKYLDQTPLMKRNPLTLKSTILVVRIVVNDEFISLRRNPTSPSFFSIKKEHKKKRGK